MAEIRSGSPVLFLLVFLLWELLKIVDINGPNDLKKVECNSHVLIPLEVLQNSRKLGHRISYCLEHSMQHFNGLYDHRSLDLFVLFLKIHPTKH